MSKIVDEWLEEFNKAGTRATYLNRITYFFNETGLTPEKLRDMPVDQIKHVLLIFRNEQLAKGLSQNGVLTSIVAVRSLCAGLNKPIKFRKGQLGKIEADNDSHVFSNGDLKLLFDVGNTQEKALIATATSLGWEISSFIELDREKISREIEHAKQNNESFIFFEDTRTKTGEARLAVLNPLAIEWISKWLATRKDKDSKLFPFTKDGVQKLLNRLAQQSGLKTTGTLRFHNIRKWLMSRLSRASFNEFEIKYVLGKSIGVSDRTYLQTLKTDVEQKYPKAYQDYLNINPMVSTEQVKRLQSIEQQLADLKKENVLAKITMQLMARKFGLTPEELEHELEEEAEKHQGEG